jgi:hypothetical protein
MIKTSERYKEQIKNKILKDKKEAKLMVIDIEKFINDNTEIDDKLKLQFMDIEDKIDYVVKNRKKLSAREAKQTGEVSFKRLYELVDGGKISNDINREEELDELKTYLNKLHHLFRYIMGTSEKSQLLLSVFSDSTDKVSYIRDDGTLMALIVGEYFDKKVLTPNDIQELIIDDIKSKYEPNSKDIIFIKKIEKAFKKLSNQKKDVEISLKEIISLGGDIKDMYDTTNLSYTINLLTKKQTTLDTINANLQPNPWQAYNYYMANHKKLKQYSENFLGKKLFEFINNKVGLHKFKKGKLMSRWMTSANNKKINRMIPLVISYCISNFCKSEKELKESYEMIARFSEHEKEKVRKYWDKMFSKLVRETTYKDITDFYKKEYKVFFENKEWDVNSKISDLVKEFKKNSGVKSSSSLESLKFTKFDTGLWFLSIAIWLKENKTKKGRDKIVELIVKTYKEKLSGKISYDGKDREVWDLFTSDGFNNTDARFDYLFKYLIEDVIEEITNESKDRQIEDKLRTTSLQRHRDILEEAEIRTTLTLFPLSSDDQYRKYYFTTGPKGKNLQWLHPNDDENKAENGFLGFIDDNLKEPWKSVNWKEVHNVHTQMDYWNLVLNHNYNLVNSVSGTDKKAIEKSIESIEELSQVNCEVTV